MTIKVRKQVYIEPHQEEILKRLTRETGISEAELIRQAISEAELIRQAIDRHTRTFIPRPDLKAWEKERTFIVHLMQQDPAPGQRTWQREELHKR
jgi:hypothetical protein